MSLVAPVGKNSINCSSLSEAAMTLFNIVLKFKELKEKLQQISSQLRNQYDHAHRLQLIISITNIKL
jgi:hypothetical protein